MAPIVFFILIMAGVAAIGYLSWRSKQKRREALALFAVQRGFEFSRTDPFDLIGSDFHLFRMGDGRGCENVLWGMWQELPVREADYWYYTETSDGKGHRSRTYHHFSVVVAEMGCALPDVTMEREDVSSWVAGHLGFHDIEFESERFNRMFKVKAQDREFAYQLLDARMINWMLSTGGDFGFEVNGPSLLVWSDRRRPTELIPLLGCAKMFCEHIPRLVWTEFGTTPARPDDSASTEERSAP
jgi:hypothetical protein